MLLGFQTQLILNHKQTTLAAQHAGVARHAYNWGLEVCRQALENQQKLPTAIDLHKRLVAEVKQAHPWYYQVSKCAPQQALRNLEQALKRWRKGLGQFPRFKRKGVQDSFYLEGSIRISGNRIKVPIFGWLRCAELLPATTPKNVVISLRAGRWYISFKYEAPTPQVEKTGEVVGVDLGIHHLATCSGGEVFANPKPYRKARQRLARLQRRLSRKQKGSTNRKKAVVQLGKAHKRVADIRQDSLHKLTTYLAKRYRVVVVEDLQVKNLLQNRKLAGSLSDCGFYELRTPSRYRERRRLEYKARLYGCQVVVADRFYPSSQLCSGCGHRQKMPLQERVFCCPCCGLELDRDLNAALNLLRWYRTTPSSGGSDACGDSSGGVVGVNSAASHGSLKQEGSRSAAGTEHSGSVC
ncbi:RNA-guided endonuclease InsQ/TnpB family protein [Synechococcus sp. W55.1]|uniref:RNA-guided endonuclease InsQ/TnpB family protein n=1 Tax=Synechococcus sp. W55.1 TaxID=2964512 RepID=UPI0039C07A3F